MNLIGACYTRKGTREFYRVTYLGARDLPMGIIFCTDRHHRAVALCVNIAVAELVKITPQRFNSEWNFFCRDVATLPVLAQLKSGQKLRRTGKLKRNWP